MIARQGTVLTFTFPLLSIALGLWLYFRSPAKYVGYVWWLWILSPEVRRIADWLKGTYTSTSVVQIAPVAVTVISALSLVRFHGLLAQRRGLPVLLMLCGLAYAFLVGAASNGPVAALYDLANWVYPILIGFHIMAYANRYSEIRESITHAVILGMLIMGVYGIAQYCLMPPWDTFWMSYSKMNSIGDPVPFGVRVFSTMNSPGPFAVTIMAGSIYAMEVRHKIRWIAGVFGFLSFCLSLVRSAWGGWAVAILFRFWNSDNNQRLRITKNFIIFLILAAPMLLIGPVAERTGGRLQTIFDIQDDHSYTVRNDFYSKFAGTAFTDVAGQGLGSTGTATKLTSDGGQLGQYGNFDSGVMNIPFVLGWPGTLLYMAGVILVLIGAVSKSRRIVSDNFASANTSIAIAVVSMLLFTNSLVGTAGLLFFGSIFSIHAAWSWRGI
ncbi:glucose-6-phosphate isomerase [Paraburkholderia sabiae]|uniref:Glucose-6-phosphate isomerase n=2 Tax=Paraburkholderia sabiae TaxID=273251 RepID=A0ABU9QC92_9BURK|nr:glucose-6-phosphate isomerase [Paraburkholderia sabiae]